MQHFFIYGKIENSYNINIIIVIQKVQGANKMVDFRPIALANFLFKIITKFLA